MVAIESGSKKKDNLLLFFYTAAGISLQINSGVLYRILWLSCFFLNFDVILWTIYVLHSLLDNITIFWGEMNSLCLWLTLKHFHYVTITASVFFLWGWSSEKDDLCWILIFWWLSLSCRVVWWFDKEGCPTTTCNILYWWWSWQNEIKHAQYIYFLYEFLKMLVMLLLLCYSI